MRASFVVLLLLTAGSSNGLAQEWAKAMFDHTSHDFGVVARGQKVEHRFPLENIYIEDIRFGVVRSGCACFSAQLTKDSLKTYEKGEIVTKVDTRRFLGRKQATLKVIFQEPFPAEVQLHCYVYIRSDVVLEPGLVRFDAVPHGQGAEAQKVAISYAGRNDWEILKAECDNPYINVRLAETGRQFGQVTYNLYVGLRAEAPVGYIHDRVVLTTNDHNRDATRVLVPVEGVVTSVVSAKPSHLLLGVLNPGQKKNWTLVVRANEPFRIIEVAADANDQFQFKWSDEATNPQLIPVVFTAGEKLGRTWGTIRIRTDVPGGGDLEVGFDGCVIAPSQ